MPTVEALSYQILSTLMHVSDGVFRLEPLVDATQLTLRKGRSILGFGFTRFASATKEQVLRWESFENSRES
jgi:hypothetical protein